MKVVIAYEGFEAGVEAMELFQRLVSELMPDAESELDLWRCELLGIPDIRKTAAAEARDADMIIVSLTEDHPLPPELLAWMELWIDAKPGQHSALVVLFRESPRNPAHPPCSRAAIERLAFRGQMRLLLREACGAGASRRLADSIDEKGSAMTETLRNCLNVGQTPPVRYFGINE